MTLFGIPLRKPNFSEITASTVMGCGLWIAAVGLLKAAAVPLAATDAGALLLVVLWGCLSARLGIRIGHGQRHLVANLLVSGLLLGVYQGALAITA